MNGECRPDNCPGPDNDPDLPDFQAAYSDDEDEGSRNGQARGAVEGGCLLWVCWQDRSLLAGRLAGRNVECVDSYEVCAVPLWWHE